MTNEEKAKELYHKYRELNLAPESAAFNAALEMAEWKDKQFADRVEMTLCIDCYEFESCKNCQKYRIKKELLPNED